MLAFPPSGRALGALLVTLALASACGDSSSTPPGGAAGTAGGVAAGNGGAAGAPHAVGGSGATPGDAGSGEATGNAGAAGGGNEGGAESGGGTSTGPGTFDSIWKQATADVLTFDSATATIPKQVTVDIPGLYSVPDPDAGVDVEVYQSLQSGALIPYAHAADATSYYRIKSPLAGAGGIYSYSIGSKFSGIFQLTDGVLTFTASFNVGTVVGSSTTHFEKVTGDFPPASWPSSVVELDLTTGGAP